MRKRITITILCLVLALSMLVMAGCQKQEPASNSPSTSASAGTDAKKDLALGLVVKSLGNSFFVDIQTGAEDAAKAITDRNVKITVMDSNNDVQKEVANCEDLATQKVDGVMLVCYDYQGSVTSVQAIQRANIPLVILDAPPANEDEVDAIVTSDNYDAGYAGAKALCEAIGGKGEVILFTNTLGYNIRLRDQGAQDAIKEFPDVKIVHVEDGQMTVDIILDKASNLLQAFPDVKGFWCASGTGGRGAVSAVTSAGKDVKVASVDGTTEECELIEKGLMLCSAAQFPKELGRIGVETIVKMIDGEKPDEKFVYVPVELVTKDNVAKFK